MKKTICILMLLTSITQSICAQSNNDKAFEVPGNIIITKRFYVNLERVANIDSLLQIFLQDIVPLKDSLADPLTAKRIDYVTDARGRKKIRFQQFQPKGTSFLINKGELASLRTVQDTINIIGIIVTPPKAKQKVSLKNPRYYHLTFYLNDLNELKVYMNGILAEKIKTIQNDVGGKWPIVLGSGFHYLKKDRSITADKPEGSTPIGTGDFLEGNITVNVQNYKNYFVPSFSLGLRLVLTNHERTF